MLASTEKCARNPRLECSTSILCCGFYALALILPLNDTLPFFLSQSKWTSLHAAASGCHLPVVLLLLSGTARINDENLPTGRMSERADPTLGMYTAGCGLRLTGPTQLAALQRSNDLQTPPLSTPPPPLCSSAQSIFITRRPS